MACLLDSSSGVVSSGISIPMHYSVVDLSPYRIPLLCFFSDTDCFGYKYWAVRIMLPSSLNATRPYPMSPGHFALAGNPAAPVTKHTAVTGAAMGSFAIRHQAVSSRETAVS
jgi:hypothetical protein